MRPGRPGSHLEVATPERVVLSLPLAGFGHRSLAYVLDFALLVLVALCAYFALTLLVSDTLGAFRALAPWVKAGLGLLVFAGQWLYWTLSEVFFDGQSLGKRALSIRVVREDGAPVGVFDAAVRNLLRAVDFLPFFYTVGGLLVLLTPKHQRLGDLLAGTLIVRQVRHGLERYQLAPSALEKERAPPLRTEETELLHGFLERSADLLPAARERLLAAMLERFAAHLPAEERAQLLKDAEGAERFLRARAGGR